MPLAYVFWHRPARDVAAGVHEERLRAFHAALGVAGSVTLRLRAAPWPGDAPAGPLYEDWYPVDAWAGLGELAERAVSGPRQAPHDAAASGTGDGAAGVYGLRRAGVEPAAAGWAGWLAKPAGMAYAPFFAALEEAAPEAAIWQRQLVLGPTPEFCVLAPAAPSLPWPARATGPRAL